MSWKKFFVGEPMPDKNDTKYKERYEREVEAGKKFAEKSGICWGAKKAQELGQSHKIAFLAIVFGFVMVCFGVNVYRLVTAYQHGAAQRPTAVERVDSAMQSVGHHAVLKLTK